jgi:hypothetical protein
VPASRTLPASQLSPALTGWIASTTRPASAASPAILACGSFLMVTPGWPSQTRVLAPALPASTASCAPSGVRTLKYGTDRSRGEAGTSSPSSRQARKRLAALSFLIPGADSPHSRPLTSVGTMNRRAPTASSALTTV